MKPILWDFIIRKLQKAYFKEIPANSFQDNEKRVDVVFENGVRFKNGICYSQKYPNSFMDIYYGSEELSEKRPTIIYLHGGGFFMGNRKSGDPLVDADAVNGELIVEIAANGFNVITPDYCLAPEYRYPNQIFQVNGLFAFLFEHGAEYHLDCENVILMGGSAGAVLTAQYGVIASNPTYANSIDITPAITTKYLKGVIIDGAPMNTKIMDWKTGAMFRTWLNTCNLKTSEQSKQIHTAAWVDDKYPPAFLTAGNDGCFPEHISELHESLIKHHVESTLYVVDIQKEREPHGYLNKFQTDPYAKEGFDRLVAFAKERTAK